MENQRILYKVKKSKPFVVGDLFVYLAVVLIVTVLFAVFIILPNKENSLGFTVTVDGEQYFTYSPASDSLEIASGKEDFIRVEKNDGMTLITVYSDGDSFNTIAFDREELTAKVTESNCSHSKDCTFSPKIKDSGAIYCAPHNLKITPKNSGGFTPPVTG
jgi:hypothetical protein